MTILKHARKVILVSTVILSTGAGVAFAATTWTITPGGNVRGAAGTTVFTDVTTGTSVTCSATQGSATTKSGRGLTNPLGGGLSATAANCTGPLGLAFSVTPANLPWLINGVSYDAATGVASGTLSGIHIIVAGSGCTAAIDGTSGSANNGLVDGTYSNGTSQSKILPTGGNLHFWNVSGCFGLIRNGDAVTENATYTVTPHQTATSP